MSCAIFLDMMSTVKSCTLTGIDAALVEIQCTIKSGPTKYNITGLAQPLAEPSTKECAVRIRSALRAIDLDMPSGEVTINLAPTTIAALRGGNLDLPIALAVLIAARLIPGEVLDGSLVIGELGLDGSVRAVRGVLAAAMLARASGMRSVIVPQSCAWEAGLVEGLTVYPVADLGEVVTALRDCGGVIRARPSPPPPSRAAIVDMAEVRGQAAAVNALATAVAARDSALLIGPPGTGKTMLARRIPTVLSEMTRAEALETTKIYSALGLANSLIDTRPFRAPHYTISTAALIGGGMGSRPGELQLASYGVLFLDELIEFSRAAIEGLAHTLRAMAPASRPLIIAAANPCPCGWHGSGARECACNPGAVERYQVRLAEHCARLGITERVEVPPTPFAAMRGLPPGESSAQIRDRIAATREGAS